MAQITASLVKELREMTQAGMMDCKKALVATDGDIEKAVDYLRENGLAKAAKKAGRIAAEGLVRFTFNEDHSQATIIEVNSESDFVSKNAEFIEFVETLAATGLKYDEIDAESLLTKPYDDKYSVQDILVNKIATIGENMKIRRIVKLAQPGVKYIGYSHMGGKIGVIIGLKTEATAEEITVCGKDVAMQVCSMTPKFVSEADVDPEYLAHEKEVLIAQAIKESPNRPQNIIEKMIAGRLQKSLRETCLVEQKFVKNGELTVKQYVDSVAKEIGKPVEVVSMIRFEVGEGLEKRNENFAEEVAKQMAGK